MLRYLFCGNIGTISGAVGLTDCAMRPVIQVCCDRKEGEVHPWCCCLLYFFVSQILGSVVLGFQEPKIQSFRGMGRCRQQSSRSAEGI